MQPSGDARTARAWPFDPVASVGVRPLHHFRGCSDPSHWPLAQVSLHFAAARQPPTSNYQSSPRLCRHCRCQHHCQRHPRVVSKCQSPAPHQGWAASVAGFPFFVAAVVPRLPGHAASPSHHLNPPMSRHHDRLSTAAVPLCCRRYQTPTRRGCPAPHQQHGLLQRPRIARTRL